VLKAGKANQDDFNRAWAAAQERELNALKSAGVKVNTVDKAAFREAVKPMIDDFLKSSDEKTRALYQAIQAAR
jgi:TRAP-type transport system periplasmic protein